MVLSRRVPSAFEPLVERLGPAVHAYLVRRAPDAADELLSEVWLAAFTSRSGFDPALGSVRGWLFGIARHVLLAHYRRAARHVGVALPEPASTDWAAVDARLDAVASGQALKEALAALPQVERELLLLVAWEELTPSEAARVVGIPAGTARSRLHRARERMRERLTRSEQVLGERGLDGEGDPP
nr:RNA polymerase sigma factor [Kribbella catacumbae]